MVKMNEVYPSRLEEYAEKYKEFFALRRENGILEVRFHYQGGELKWCGGPQHGILRLCEEIAHDPENEVVIITGTGDNFVNEGLPIDSPDGERFGVLKGTALISPYATYDWWYNTQTREPHALANLRIPIISAINGSVYVHPELVLISDVVICSDDATFSENHFSAMGCPPGDGTWPLWEALVGVNRARYMMWMGAKVTAQQALDWGVVNEVVPKDKLLDRAWEIARFMMSKPRYSRRATHMITSQFWRDKFCGQLEFGLAHEGYAVVSDHPIWPEDHVQR